MSNELKISTVSYIRTLPEPTEAEIEAMDRLAPEMLARMRVVQEAMAQAFIRVPLPPPEPTVFTWPPRPKPHLPACYWPFVLT